MTPAHASLMARYNSHMNQQIYAAAENLPMSEVMRDRGAFFPSIFATLNHIAVADTIWLHRFAAAGCFDPLRRQMQAFERPGSLRQTIRSDLKELGLYRRELDQIILDWAQILTTEHLAITLAYQNMAGRSARKNLGALVTHFFNHQTHHRGQASTLLFQAGVDIGVTDLLALIPDEESPASLP
jgi:uncharacterized damage-inducible protein DinB